jgi:thiol-disulfide isomerase/thioredoxin
VTLRLALRVAAAAAVAVLAVLLGWDLTHQPKSVVAQVARHEIVRAPEFNLERLTGKGKLSLGTLRGKAVVVNFWASDCAPCKEEMPRLVSFARAWEARSVVVVGIDLFERRKGPGRAFSSRYGATYPMVFDPNGSTVDRWGIAVTPQTFFVDRHGRIVRHVLGPVSTSVLEEGARRALRT